MRAGGELVTFIFFIIGIILTIKSKEFKGTTIYEQTYQLV